MMKIPITQQNNQSFSKTTNRSAKQVRRATCVLDEFRQESRASRVLPAKHQIVCHRTNSCD
jgi:hypothetical protein